ncbi:MAG: SCP2 sterol-binding domain-containing protein [Dehalococcoidia bacterium]|jgi:putative sterol carrier protein
MPVKKFKYLSKEWTEEVEKRLQKELTPEKMKHITSSMLTIYTNCPDKKTRALYYKLKDGKVESVSLVEGTLPKAEFSITADYEMFAKISRAELKARSALMSGKMTLKGNLVKALTLSPTVDRLNEVIATVPTEY